MQMGENMDNLSKEQLILLVKEMNNIMHPYRKKLTFIRNRFLYPIRRHMDDQQKKPTNNN